MTQNPFQTPHQTGIMQYRHTRESAQNKPHLSSPPKHPHLTVKSSLCPQGHNGMISMHTPTATGPLITNKSSLCPLKSQSRHRLRRTFITLSPLQTPRHLRTTRHRSLGVERSSQTHQLSGHPIHQSNATKAPSGLTFIPPNLQASITSTSGDH